VPDFPLPNGNLATGFEVALSGEDKTDVTRSPGSTWTMVRAASSAPPQSAMGRGVGHQLIAAEPGHVGVYRRRWLCACLRDHCRCTGRRSGDG